MNFCHAAVLDSRSICFGPQRIVNMFNCTLQVLLFTQLLAVSDFYPVAFVLIYLFIC